MNQTYTNILLVIQIHSLFNLYFCIGKKTLPCFVPLHVEISQFFHPFGVFLLKKQRSYSRTRICSLTLKVCG